MSSSVRNGVPKCCHPGPAGPPSHYLLNGYLYTKSKKNYMLVKTLQSLAARSGWEKNPRRYSPMSRPGATTASYLSFNRQTKIIMNNHAAHIVLKLCYDKSSFAQLKALYYYVKQHIPLHLISILFIRKSVTKLLASLSCDHPVFPALQRHPWQVSVSSDVQSLYETRGWRLNAEQLRLAQHRARGCLYRCYYGDILSALCYAIKF